MAGYKPEDELSWNNREEVLKLPVPPQNEPELYTPGQNQTWNTTDVGPFKAIGYPGLYSTSIESFFPAHEYPFCTYTGFPSPEECVEMIKRWQASRRPIRYIRAGLINDAFAIEGFTYSKETGTGDIKYRLELERYRFASDANPQTGNSFREGYSTILLNGMVSKMWDIPGQLRKRMLIRSRSSVKKAHQAMNCRKDGLKAGWLWDESNVYKTIWTTSAH